MNLQLSRSPQPVSGEIAITGSKSEANRLLILQALYPEIQIQNLSNSDDTVVLQKALKSEENTIDVHHAGTAMRFLTAYFASKEGREVVLTGSRRMRERPIALLVNALRDLGADIRYLENDGFAPLAIKGEKLLKNRVSLKANVSSQYISALMLIAPSLPHGLEITLEGNVTSVPYIQMSLSLLKNAGFTASFEDNVIKIVPQESISNIEITVESDWSSASYFYGIAALSDQAQIKLSSYKNNSYQGDAVITRIYEQFGVKTTFSGDVVILRKESSKKPSRVQLQLADSPDLAQTIAVTCFGLGIEAELTGLHTLKIKETDRLLALKTEIEKLGGKMNITNSSLHLFPTEGIHPDIKIATYNDHRMAMAFAPLALKTTLQIEEAEVVSKSYPDFWKDFKGLGFSIVEV